MVIRRLSDSRLTIIRQSSRSRLLTAICLALNSLEGGDAVFIVIAAPARAAILGRLAAGVPGEQECVHKHRAEEDLGAGVNASCELCPACAVP